MKKTKKLKIEAIKIKSFITDVDFRNIMGGSDILPGRDYNNTEPPDSNDPRTCAVMPLPTKQAGCTDANYTDSSEGCETELCHSVMCDRPSDAFGLCFYSDNAYECSMRGACPAGWTVVSERIIESPCNQASQTEYCVDANNAAKHTNEKGNKTVTPKYGGPATLDPDIKVGNNCLITYQVVNCYTQDQYCNHNSYQAWCDNYTQVGGGTACGTGPACETQSPPMGQCADTNMDECPNDTLYIDCYYDTYATPGGTNNWT